MVPTAWRIFYCPSLSLQLTITKWEQLNSCWAAFQRDGNNRRQIIKTEKKMTWLWADEQAEMLTMVSWKAQPEPVKSLQMSAEDHSLKLKRLINAVWLTAKTRACVHGPRLLLTLEGQTGARTAELTSGPAGGHTGTIAVDQPARSQGSRIHIRRRWLRSTHFLSVERKE